MRLHRFYISEKIGSQKEVTVHSAELVNQIVRVFRLRTGDKVILFDGSGNDYECVISGGDKNHMDAGSRIVVRDRLRRHDTQEVITFFVEKSEPSRFMPTCEVALCAAVVKKDTFEWIVEKATELGVTKIIPIMAERSEKKNLNEERLQKIAIEASEQSGRGTVPKVYSIISLKQAVELVKEEKISAIAFHIDGEPFSKTYTQTTGNIFIFIGPEGGWSPVELEMFHDREMPLVSLGTQVLRAETAVVAALSKVLL